MIFKAKKNRYDTMSYRRCGKSGIDLPEVSLGLWHNFGGVDDLDKAKKILFTAFDKGITHFDLANNYGPPYGSAEKNFGKVMNTDLRPYRDEMIISTKAGYDMWPGPYGDRGSKKYLVSSLDQSLKRMKLDYVDIFYHHRPDPDTPLEETMGALDLIVRQGKALYAGVSNYDHEQLNKAQEILNKLGTPCLINQIKYSMFVRWSEEKLLAMAQKNGVGIIAFSPLAQGLLTDKYLSGIPGDSRAGKKHGYLKKEEVNAKVIAQVKKLNTLAEKRGQTLAQMALAWLLKDNRVTSVLIGASSVKQVKDNYNALQNKQFTESEIRKINEIL
jgi:L-glyceraldehyde 3-phosphate reductase